MVIYIKSPKVKLISYYLCLNEDWSQSVGIHCGRVTLKVFLCSIREGLAGNSVWRVGSCFIVFSQLRADIAVQLS